MTRSWTGALDDAEWHWGGPMAPIRQDLADRIIHFLQHAYALKQLHVHEAIQISQLFLKVVHVVNGCDGHMRSRYVRKFMKSLVRVTRAIHESY